MTLQVLQLMARLGLDTTQAEAKAATMATALGAAGPLALAAAAGAAAVAAVGVVAVKMAGDFETATNTLVTGAGLASGDLGKVRADILQMAKDTGTSTGDLVNGLYMISSAGFNTAQSLAILKAAAEGAKVGGADLGTTADAVTTIMKDYGATGITAAQATNTLIETVASGKVHLQDLAGALAQVLPAAQSAGVGLNDVMAAMAAQTAAGVSADMAATHLRQLIIALMAPTKQASDALLAMGLSTDQVAAMMHKSLPDAVYAITQRAAELYGYGTPKYMEAIKTISGGSREMQGMLALSGVHMKDFQTDLKNISDKVREGGTDIAGWARVQSSFNQQVARAGEVVQTLMIQLGDKLLPVGTQLFGWLASNAIPALQNFVQWISGSSASSLIFKVALIAIAGAITAYLVTAFIAWAQVAVVAAIANLALIWPILLIGAAIALLVVGIVLLVTHWKQVSAWLESTWTATVNAVGAGFSWLGTQVHNIIQTVVGWFKWLYDHNYFFKDLVDNIVEQFTIVKAIASAIWKALVANIIADVKVLLTIVGWINDNIIKPVSKFFTDLWNQAVQWGAQLIKMFIQGLQSQLALLKKAAGDIMNVVKALMGFHSPTPEGPGHDADTWAPNLMAMFAQGIHQATPAVMAAAAQMMSGLKVEMTGSGGGGAGSAGLPSGGLAPLSAGSGNAGAGGSHIIEIHLTSKMDTKTVAKEILRVTPGIVQFGTGHKAGAN